MISKSRGSRYSSAANSSNLKVAATPAQQIRPKSFLFFRRLHRRVRIKIDFSPQMQFDRFSGSAVDRIICIRLVGQHKFVPVGQNLYQNEIHGIAAWDPRDPMDSWDPVDPRGPMDSRDPWNPMDSRDPRDLMLLQRLFDHRCGFVAVSNLNAFVDVVRFHLIPQTNPGNQTIRFVVEFFDCRCHRMTAKTRRRRRHGFHRTGRIGGVQLFLFLHAAYRQISIFSA